MAPDRPDPPDHQRYVVAGCRPWNCTVFESVRERLAGEWRFVADRDELSAVLAAGFNPRYVFFLHWSWVVPGEVLDRCECVCFHMTDVPFGRGGSPLQNLIVRGHRETKLSALRMTDQIDAGPVYLKRPLSLEGAAEEIYIRATRLSLDMARDIAAGEPTPVPQEGQVVTFARRTPGQSRIDRPKSLDQIYDFIRMLDAEGYPHAFIECDGFRYTFRGVMRYSSRLEADVRIEPIPEEE